MGVLETLGLILQIWSAVANKTIVICLDFFQFYSKENIGEDDEEFVSEELEISVYDETHNLSFKDYVDPDFGM